MANTCKSCGAPVRWARHVRTGKPAPLEPDPRGTFRVLTDGNGEPIYDAAEEGEATYASHYATCPQAAAWRERNR